MTELTSIILTCKIRSLVQAQMTMTVIDMINKFTNRDEYELIVVDPEPAFSIRDDYKTFPKYIHLMPSPDPDYASCMNLGAKEAKGKYLVFIQNDVFVQEGWLSGLRQYLESGKFDVVFPEQFPKDRAYVLERQNLDPFNPLCMGEARDAGLIMMTREIFDKTGGWGEGMSLLAEQDMYQKLDMVGCRQLGTSKVYIAHIMAGTNFMQMHMDKEGYDKRMDKNVKRMNG
jgi:glycosyltransferase involved in cell wall biosynthesis